MKYPGAKGNSGICQFFINNIPFHARYFELFAGSAKLYREKRPAAKNILNDVNLDTMKKLTGIADKANTEFYYEDFYQVIKLFKFTRKDFIYLDPPYPEQDRRSGAKIYKFEMMEAQEHLKLLTRIKTIDANIMISTGRNDLYREQLKTWYRYEFKTIGHKGPRIEVIYCNYPPPEFLHQYNLFGSNFTRRQQIKRISERFRERLTRIHDYEKHIIIQDIIRDHPEAVRHFINQL